MLVHYENDNSTRTFSRNQDALADSLPAYSVIGGVSVTLAASNFYLNFKLRELTANNSIFNMMSADNDDMDLGLYLGYSSNCIRRKLKENPGAGVNAESIVDMTFAASDSLSEIVWSPHSGLSLKCAECSLADKKPFLLRNVGPSNMVPSPSQGIRSNGTDDEKKTQGSLIISAATFHMDSEIAQGINFTQSPINSARPLESSSHKQDMESRDEMEEGKIKKRILVRHGSENAGHLGEEDEELCDRRNEQMADMAERSQKKTDRICSNIDIAINEASSGNLNEEISSDCDPIVRKAVNGGQILEEVITAAEVHMEILSEAHVIPLQKSTCLVEPDKEVKGAIEDDRKNKIKTHSPMVPIAEKLERTAENDLWYPITKDAFQKSEDRLPRGCSLPLETSPGIGNSHSYPVKGKEKALSDGDIGRRFSHDGDDSQESVESCNSAWLLGKRRWNFDQQLNGESKRFKKQMDGCPASTSIIKPDSSFMNWISNMVKGFSNSNQEGPSIGLTLAHSNYEHSSILHETIICREHQESVNRNMGFQTIFRSLYCPSTKLIEARVSRDDCSAERLQEFLQSDKTNVQSSLMSASVQNVVSFGHIFMENEKILPTSTEFVVGQSDQAFGNIFMANEKILPTSTEVVVGQSDQAWNFSVITPMTNDFKTNSAEDKAPSIQECCRGNNGINSSDSLGNHKITVAEHGNPQVASDDGAIYDLSNKKDLFGSLWIARFSTKKDSTSLNLNHSKRDNSQAINCPGDCTRPAAQTQTSPGLPIEEKYSDTRVNTYENSGNLGKELQTFSVNAEFSLGFKEIHDQNYPDSLLKLNSILPSQGFKSSEAMASMFARRLDALKHIIGSDAINDATRTEPTCFYCGKSGHNLEECSEVTDTELEYLLRNMNSYDWPEDSPFFCIRCFQLDHWAVMCPVMTSSRQQQLENKISSVNHLNATNQKLCSGNERKCFFDEENHHKFASSSREEHFMNTNLIKPMSNVEEFYGKRSSSSNETRKQITSNSGENKLRKQWSLPLSNLVGVQIAKVSKGMFDAVRRLQVSRADLFKWINSNVSLSHLEGLFLRLRLGKGVAGLGRTGYYVACITGDQEGEPMKDSITCISVSVEGIKCLVGTQYISNHDFLEDELIVWWSRTLKSGGKIPSTEDLETKFKQRIKLGF